MFELEQTITEWKTRFVNVDSMTVDDLRELEGHLRDTMTDLLHKGLSEEEAFWVAATRLGHPPALGHEYGKVNCAHVWRKRMLWMLGGYVGGVAFTSLITGVGSLGASAAAFAGFGGAPAGAASVAVLAIGWAVLLGCVYLQARTPSTGVGSDRVSIAWCIGFVAMILVGRSLNVLGSVIHVRVTGMSEMGHWAMWNSIGGIAVHGCVLLICIAMMIAFSQPQSDRAEVAR